MYDFAQLKHIPDNSGVVATSVSCDRADDKVALGMASIQKNSAQLELFKPQFTDKDAPSGLLSLIKIV